MKIATVQFEPVLWQKELNLNKIKEYINEVDSELIVFPELALTGYSFLSRYEVAQEAESIDGDIIAELQHLSTSLNKIIIVGFPEKNRNKLFNSAAILIPNRIQSRVYRKTHLFYKEKFCFDEGNSGFFVIDIKEFDLKLGTMICYDWRFPESTRTLALNGADLIVSPSNLVTNLWHKVMPARAIENKVYVAVANRIGKETRNDEELVFNGESAIYNYYGYPLVKAHLDNEIVLIADIDPAKTRNKSFNSFNDIFKDRREEFYYK